MANESIDPRDVVIDDVIDPKDVIRDGDEEIWGPKRSDMLRMRQAFAADDPLGVLDGARRAEIEPRVRMEQDPEDAARRVALSAYFSRTRRKDISFVYDNLDGIMEQYAGKKTSVKEMYNEIRGMMAQGSVKPGFLESTGSALKSGIHKQNATVWNMLGTLSRLNMESMAAETMWKTGDAQLAEKFRESGKQAQEQARGKAKIQEELSKEEAGYAAMNPEWFTKSEGIGDWLRNAGLMLVQTSPQLLTQAGAASVSGGGSLALIGAYTANDKYYELAEERPDMGAVNTAVNVIGTALINAALEKVSVGIISGKLSEKVAKEGIKSGVKAIFKYFGLAFAEEAASEGLEQFAENALDILTGAKNKELAEGVSVGQLLMAGVRESAIIGGASGIGFAGPGFRGLRAYNRAREGMINSLESEVQRLSAIEKPSDEEVKLLKNCQTALESGDVDSMLEVGREIRLETEKRKAESADMTPEDDAESAKREYGLRNGALRHNPEETYEAVYQAAQTFGNVEIEAISGIEGMTESARAEAERLGIDPANIRAWYSPESDKIYINAAKVRPSEVPGLLLHEAAVHKGLPAVLGKQYDAVMNSIYGQFREEIETVNELYHYDLESEDERRMAAEEYLAERAEFCGHDWRAYAESHEEEIEEYIAEHGLSRENRKGAVRGLMAENGDLELRPSWWKEFLQRVKMFFRKWKGFEDYRFTDREIETLIMRGLRKAKGKNRYERGERREESSAGERFAAGDRLKYTIDNAMPSKEGYRVERVNENAGAEFNELQGVTCKDLQGVETWSKEEWIAYMSENGIIGKHSVPALEGRLVEVRGNLPKRLKGHSAYQDKLSMISIIPEMLENAVLVQSEGKPREGHFDNIKSHILAVKVRIGDGDSSRRYVVGMVIHEDSNGNLYYEHELTDIQKYADSAANQGHNLAGTPSASVMNIIRKSLLSSGFDAKNEKNTRFSVDQTETEEFKRWFGDSKVVDNEGNPLVVYHGTLADFTEFRKDHIGSRYSYDDRGFFFLDRKSIADDYARSEFDSSRKGKVLACYVSLQKPLIIDRKWTLKNSLGDVFRDNDVIDFWDAYQPFVMDEVDRAKADGVIVKDGKTTMVVAFEPNQIKSATDNIGTFDPENPDIRFSVESYSEEDLGDMVTFMKPYVGRAMERSDADYLKHLRENGFDAASESDAHVVAAEALKANQRDARAAGKKAMYDWLILNDYWFGRVFDAIGKTDFLIRPSQRFVGEDFTGSYISPEFVKYSGKLKVKDKEAKLEKAKGYHSDELAKLIASKTGGDELQIEQDLIDYFRHLKKRSSKADKENGQFGLFDKYSEWKASSPLLSAKLDEKLQAEWEAEKAAQLEEDFVSLVEHGTQIDSDWVKDNRELWKMLYQRLLSKEAPYHPAKKDIEALNAALRQEESDAASYAKGWADAKAALLEEKRKEFREFREKVLSSKAEALKLQDEALAFARAHLPGENQGEFAKSILALMRIDNTPTRKHPEGKRKEALENLFERILARSEELRRSELLEDFEKRMKQMGMRADGSGKLIGRSDPETQAQIEQIIEAVKLDPDEVIMRTEVLTERLEALRDAGEDAADIETELAILDRYGALYHKDLVELEDACRSFHALAVTGRNNLKELIEQRAKELEGQRNHIEDLVRRGRETSPQERRRKLARWKERKVRRALEQSFWEMNSLDSLLSYQNRPGESDKDVRDLQERINRADEEGKTLNRKNADDLIDEIDRIWGVKNRYNRVTVLQSLRERVDRSGVFRKQASADEKEFEYRMITAEDAEEVLRDYDNGGKQLNDYEAEALRHQMRTRKWRIEKKGSDYFRDGVTDPLLDELNRKSDTDEEGMYYIPSIKFEETRVEESLTQMEGLYLRLLWNQPDVRYKMRFNGWDEESIAGLDAFLKPEVKELGKWMVSELERDRVGIGRVYKALYFSGFPKEENYFPTVYDTSKEGLNGRITVDLTQEGAGGQPLSSTPGAVKLRRFHLKEPKIADALTVFTNHRMMMNHFVSHGEIARELRGIYLGKRVSEALKDVFGIDYYNTLKKEIADFIHGGNADVRNNIVFTHLLNNWTRIKMLWNIGSGVKQMFGGVSYMKYGDIPASAMARGIADFWKHPVENANHLMETEYFKNRWQGGMNREMRSLMDSTGLNSGYFQTFMRDLDAGGFYFLRFGDAVSTVAYGHAVYKYHYDKLVKEGMSKADAERGALAEWRMATERTQQSGNVSMLNSWQKGSSTQKLFTNFLSNPILLCQSHSRDIYNAVVNGHKGSAISAGQKLLVSGLVSVIMAGISSMWRYGVNFDKYEVGDFAFEALSDAVCGIPAIGPYMTAVFNALNGGREKSIPVLDDISRSVRSGYRIAEKFDEDEINEDTLKDVITILQGLGLVTAPAAQGGSIMREIRKLVRLTETDQ